MLCLVLPRISRRRASFAHAWRNASHSLNIRNNEFSHNELFELTVQGYYAQLNITKNLFLENKCRDGLVRLADTEKHFFVYANHVERNEARFMFEMQARSHVDLDLDLRSLFVDNVVQHNRPLSSSAASSASASPSSSFPAVRNAPNSYVLAVRGLQNCSFNRNLLENAAFDYELVGALTTATLNSTIDATLNWWGTAHATQIKQRLFDIHEWNDHAWVNFVPYYANRVDYSLSRAQPDMTPVHGDAAAHQQQQQWVLGGIVTGELSLMRQAMPYQVRADLTVMPGATLHIGAGVEIEFYPNVGILVLGDLKADGTEQAPIRMRPVRRNTNRAPYYSAGQQSQSEVLILSFHSNQESINRQLNCM